MSALKFLEKDEITYLDKNWIPRKKHCNFIDELMDNIELNKLMLGMEIVSLLRLPFGVLLKTKNETKFNRIECNHLSKYYLIEFKFNDNTEAIVIGCNLCVMEQLLIKLISLNIVVNGKNIEMVNVQKYIKPIIMKQYCEMFEKYFNFKSMLIYFDKF